MMQQFHFQLYTLTMKNNFKLYLSPNVDCAPLQQHFASHLELCLSSCSADRTLARCLFHLLILPPPKYAVSSASTGGVRAKQRSSVYTHASKSYSIFCVVVCKSCKEMILLAQRRDTVKLKMSILFFFIYYFLCTQVHS